MKKFILLTLFAALAMPQAADAQQAQIVAGFEIWQSASNLANGPGDASFTGTGTGTYTSDNGSISNEAPSIDGTFGSSTLATADATTESNNDGSRLINGANHTYTFTFTNTSGSDIDLDAFHFDLGTLRPDSARTWTLSVDAGGSISSSAGIATGTIDPPAVEGVPESFDIDVDLTGLTDSTLDANGTAIFTLDLTGGIPGSPGHHGYLDNVAISSVPIEQGPIIAAFETWASNTAFAVTPNFPATFENTGTATYTSTNGSIDARGASTDATFGTNATSAADTSTASANTGSRLTNGASHTYTFTFTDTSGSDTDLGFFHFDFGTFRPNSSRTWTLSTLAGGSISDVTALATGEIGPGVGGQSDFFNVDVNLNGLTDSTLDANGTAIFMLELSGGVVGAGGHDALLDNVALSAATASSVIKGDVDMSGVVDFADIPAFIAVLQGGGFQAEADADCSTVVDFADIPAFIAILQAG